MSLSFGTDGIRGVANTELTVELSLALGQAAVRVFGARTFLIGRDTRRSGPMLSGALAAGMQSAGADVVDLGVLPTPALAFASAQHGVPSAVISASHNPYADNGIKFFGPDGGKLSRQTEAALEREMHTPLELRPAGVAVGTMRAQVADGASIATAYADHLVASVQNLDGVDIILDCANGAASGFAYDVFARAGADPGVLTEHASPDGVNINESSGSTHPERLQRAVVAAGADLGLAFDGDADRVLAVDHTGALIDGDHVLAMLALDMKARGVLVDDTLVVTVMSNLGLKIAMEAAGIHVHETPVGDRHVLEALNANGWSLGGEQSGHIILPALATTGDGMLTGLRIGELVKRSGRSLQALASEAMTQLPQTLINVKVSDRTALTDAAAVWDAVREAEASLGTNGRVLLRPSGTESIIRVMVEAPTQTNADEVATRLAAVVEAHV